ncbi:DMT family transporter [Janibacter alittae]|uniref:SMR family transporter n=1 Tax=Janibacter alittae TaxID=3115209 RepID=A0ABZ2MJ90_9MICO
MTKWFLLVGAIVCEVTASLSLKAALEEPLFYLVVAAGFGTAFALLAAVLRRGMGIGVAYGIWSATGVVLTTVLSSVIYGETVTGLMGLGIALIIAGVLLVELGSHDAEAVHEVNP